MKMPGERIYRVSLTGEDWACLAFAAHHRGVEPRDLLLQLVHVVLRDGLINAVLDDDKPVLPIKPSTTI
jgi:hypothetical protein